MNNRQLFYQYLGQTSEFPLSIEIERASGVYMYGPDGKRYLDLISGISVSSVGHSHPEVTRAVKEQADKYMHLMVYGEFVQAPQVELSKLLGDNLPSALDNFFYVNSGSEAIEGAIKLAKRYTGRHEVVAFENAYHGSTQGSLSVMGYEPMKNAFRPLIPGVRFLRFNQNQDLDQITHNTSAVLLETIQGEAGIIPAEKEFVREIRKRCDETGALLIFDEIQAGCGRSGKLWAFEHLDVQPDILTLAKGLGGGMPIGVFISSKKIMNCLTHDPVLGHITTFGGNAVCVAAALAAMKTIIKGELWKHAKNMGEIFLDKLNHPLIKNKRGKGLMMAIEFENFEVNKKIIDRLIDKGILTDWFLFAPHSLRIAPPLIINEQQVIFASDTITETLDTLINSY